MKSPNDLQTKLRTQWDNTDLRQHRLLHADSWPIQLTIGKPPATTVKHNMPALKTHLDTWRIIKTGTLHWKSIAYRDISDPINIPEIWQINSPSEWISICDDARITSEFNILETIIRNIPDQFHTTIIRQRNQVLARTPEQVILICHVAEQLHQGYAQGKPLRALCVCGCDSKFFERNRHLLTTLLAIRFGEQVKDLGLEKFLDANEDDNHWLLVAPLSPSLLPFKQLRIRASELQKTALPSHNIVIVENERCLHQLPKLDNTIAILGAGLNLNWMQAQWLTSKNIAYWGDMDTWGLNMLATARNVQPHLRALMMNRESFERFRKCAVIEQTPFSAETPMGLTPDEQDFYQFLFEQDKGRLEQEFLAGEFVCQKFEAWLALNIA